MITSRSASDIIKEKRVDKNPLGFLSNHYARVWYKKEKPAYRVQQETKLSDLIGKKGQKTCFMVGKDGYKRQFIYREQTNKDWDDLYTSRESITKNFRWSHSPFTKYEDANEFIFEEAAS